MSAFWSKLFFGEMVFGILFARLARETISDYINAAPCDTPTYLCRLADFGANDLPLAGFVLANRGEESLSLCERRRTCQRGSYVDVLQRYLEKRKNDHYVWKERGIDQPRLRQTLRNACPEEC